MRRRGTGSIVANPVLVGAVSTLVVLVAVFLSYNANNGLPFVPTRTLYADVPNGDQLVKGDEVRQGGDRVGVVSEMTPVRLRSGRVVARLKLKLDKNVGALPVDTYVVIRPRGVLGLKYVELNRGHARRTFPDGATLPPSQTITPVDLDRVYGMFDRPTRQASRQNLLGFGQAFVGRGEDLNTFIAQAPALLGVLRPVMRSLADPNTQLARFFDALDRTSRVVAPVSDVYAGTFKTMADTFQAIDHDPAALRATISKSPPTEAVATASLRVQRPLLVDLTGFGNDLSAAARELPTTLPPLNSALEIGAPVLRRSTQLDADLQGAMGALRDLATAPTTDAALRGLTATVATLQPQLRFLGPYITVCNDWNMFWTFTAEHLSAHTSTGSAQRAMLNTQGQQDNSVGQQEAILPAAGENVKSGTPQYLHVAAYGRAIDDQGNADCQTGQQGYIRGANPFTQLTDPHYQRVVFDPPRSAKPRVGSTFQTFDGNGQGHGRNPDHVPAGETFTGVPGGTGEVVATP